MGLPWVRLDTQFPSNPKILALTAGKHHKAAFVYLCSLAYSGSHQTDGYLPANCLPFIHATMADAKKLVEVGFWVPAPGGWDINGWHEFQVSSEENLKRREKAQKAAAARWRTSQKGQLRGISNDA